MPRHPGPPGRGKAGLAAAGISVGGARCPRAIRPAIPGDRPCAFSTKRAAQSSLCASARVRALKKKFRINKSETQLTMKESATLKSGQVVFAQR